MSQREKVTFSKNIINNLSSNSTFIYFYNNIRPLDDQIRVIGSDLSTALDLPPDCCGLQSLS